MATDRQQTCLIQLGVFSDVGPHKGEGGQGEGVDEEERLVRVLAELGVHALLINPYIEMREIEMKSFSFRCLPNLTYMLS